jgi:hypothetical protein
MNDTASRERPQPRAAAGVGFTLPHPASQRLGRAADLDRDGLDGGPLRIVLALRLHNHSHGPFLDLGRKPD